MGLFDNAMDALDRGIDRAGEMAGDAKTAVYDRAIETSKLAQEFGRTCRDGFSFGWHEANGGNLSCLLDAGEASEICKRVDAEARGAWTGLARPVPALAGKLLMVTASGAHLRDVADDIQHNAGIVEVGANGESWRRVWGFEGASPTSELLMHLQVLDGAQQRDTRVVYHAHPENTIALTALAGGSSAELTRLLWSTMAEAIIAFPRGISAPGWFIPGSPELASAACEELQERDAMLLANHGIICTGDTLKNAFGLCQTIEKAAAIRLKMGLEAAGISTQGLRGIAARYSLDVDEGLLS